MDFALTEDQVALQSGLRSFCDDRYAFDRIVELEKTPLDRARWSELAEMGVFSLRLPEAEGGVELGMAEAVLVFAELGRRAVPGPLLWSHLTAALVPGAAVGEAIVGGLDRWHEGNEPLLVEYAEGLDTLLVLTRDGLHEIDARALSGANVETPLDPLTPLTHIEKLPQWERIGDAGQAEQLRLEGTLLTAALQLGIAEITTELAVEYAKSREQFARPIASFQAIKHFAADMYVRQEAARAAVYAAGATFDDHSVGDVPRAVASARVVAGEAAMKNARMCVQIYGGMGYTWEMPPHYYLKRAFVLENAFTSADDACETIAERIDA
ncbi:MAG: acyl-CoA dehydrogenase family protein [Myxococcota bacterium]